MEYDIETIRGIIKGSIVPRKCPDCDVNGIQYWDGETGLGVSPTPSGIDPEWLDWGTCETCKGLSYILHKG